MANRVREREGSRNTFNNIHVDCDPIVYKVGFRCEETTYFSQDGSPHKTMTDALAYSGGMKLDISAIERKVVPMKWGVVKGELEMTLRKHKNLFGPKKSYLYLSPSDYFRHHLTDDYKGNRSSIKPHWFKEIRTWFESKGARIVKGLEADDVLAINHFHLWKKGGDDKAVKTSLIIGEDKDFNNVPGWHYNPGKNLLYYVGSYTAITNFYRQMIAGDTADNIKGVPGKGAIAAEKLLPSNRTISEKEHWKIVKQCYLDYAEKKGIPREEIIAQLMLNAHLLHILWVKDGWFEPPTEEDEDICENSKWLTRIQELKGKGVL